MKLRDLGENQSFWGNQKKQPKNNFREVKR
jgi:hypothetical protein